jgi:hypothetical protein
VTKRGNAELLEIGLGQVRQQIDVDVVVPKRLLIAFQPQLVQPRRCVHQRPPMAIEVAAAKLSKR